MILMTGFVDIKAPTKTCGMQSEITIKTGNYEKQ